MLKKCGELFKKNLRGLENEFDEVRLNLKYLGNIEEDEEE